MRSRGRAGSGTSFRVRTGQQSPLNGRIVRFTAMGPIRREWIFSPRGRPSPGAPEPPSSASRSYWPSGRAARAPSRRPRPNSSNRRCASTSRATSRRPSRTSSRSSAGTPRTSSPITTSASFTRPRARTPTPRAQYRLALTIDTKFGPALYNLAILRTAANDSDGAIDLYRQAIAANPKDASAHFNLGLLLRKAGQTAMGNAEVQIAVNLDSSLRTKALNEKVPLTGQ